MLDKAAIRKLATGWFKGYRKEVAARLATAEPGELILFALEFVAECAKKEANEATALVMLNALVAAVEKATKKRDEIQAQKAKYNGWTNYETWALHQWSTGQQPQLAGGSFFPVAAGKESFATNLQQYFTDMVLAKDAPSWRSDLLVKGLGRVNWDELAEALMD